MANMYGRPIQSDVTVTPFTMPAETLEKGLISTQNRFDNIINVAEEQQQLLNNLEGRAGIEKDEEFLKETRLEYEQEKNRFYEELKGDFSSTKVGEIQDRASSILSPRRSILQAIAANNDLLKQRKALKAEYDALGVTLDFDDSLETKASYDESGNPIIYKSTGIEKRGDWLGSLNSLFDNIKSSSVENNLYTEGQLNDQSFKTAIKQSISSNEQNIKVGDVEIESNRIKNIIDTQLNEFIDADSNGNQMYRWFKKYYSDKLKAENPNIDGVSLEKLADLRARNRIKEAITDISYNYRHTDIVTSETQKLLEVEPKASKTGSDDKLELPKLLGTPITTYVNPTDKSLKELASDGAGFSYITAKANELNTPFNPNSTLWTNDFSSIASIPGAIGALLYAGPRDDNDVTGDNYQFQGLSLARKGYLQRLDDQSSSNYKGKNNRAVAELQGQKLTDYIQFLKQKNQTTGSYTKLIDELTKLENEGKPYVVNTMDVIYQLDGSYELTVSEFFNDDENIKSEVESFKETHQAEIATRLAHLDSLESVKRSIKDRERSARNAAGFTDYEDFERARQDANSNPEKYKAFIDGSDDNYMKAVGFSDSNLSFVFKNKNIDESYRNEIRTALVDYTKKAVGSGYRSFEQYAINTYGKPANTVEFWKEFMKDYGIEDKTVHIKNPIDGSTITYNASEHLNRFMGTSMVSGYSDDMAKDYNEISSRFYEKNKDKIDKRMAEYYRILDEQIDPYYIRNMRISIATDEKDFMDILAKAVYSSIEENGLYRIKPSESGVSEEENVTIGQLREAALDSGIKPEDLDDVYKDFTPNDLTTKDRIVGFRVDSGLKGTDSDIVIDVAIGSEVYEVRNIRGIKGILTQNQTINGQFLDILSGYNQSLKANDYTSGIVNLPLNPADPNILVSTEIFTAMNNDDNVAIHDSNATLKKGDVFIYAEDGKRIGFNSPENAIKYLMNLYKEGLNYDRTIGTPLALPDTDFEQRYGITKEEYRKYYEENIKPMQMTNAIISDIIKENGFNSKHIEVDGENSYIKRSVNKNKDYFISEGYKEEDIDVTADGNYRLKINSYDEDNLPEKLEMKEGAFTNGVQMMPVFERAFNDLPDDVDTQVITNARRSLQEHAKLYQSDPSNAPAYSDHFMGQAIDLRYDDDFYTFLQSDRGIQWLKDHNLRVLVHTIKGNAKHFHISYNLPTRLPNGKIIPAKEGQNLVVEQ